MSSRYSQLALVLGSILALISPIVGVTSGAARAETPAAGVTLPLGPGATATEDARADVSQTPSWAPAKPGAVPAAASRLEGYQVIDSLQTGLFVTAGDEYVVHYDHAGLTFAEHAVPYELTEAAWQAIAVAPTWLQRDIEWNLRYLNAARQDGLAALLLGLDDPRTIDEVAFQIAHLSWSILQNPYWDTELMAVNAEMIYQIEPELQFVDLVEYDSGDGDFYTTTTYRIASGRDTSWVEVPREIYYWWVLMPKVSDERPMMDASVYGYFWREYLYYHHDQGYPLLQEVMQSIQVLWDGQRHDWSGGRPFSDDMLAVDAVGNWCSETVPDAAAGDRPIQPNVIAHGHNGNCGELQDLVCAAARTCLIPTGCTMDILEDHVWCEMWWDTWHPYQVDLGRGPTHIDNSGIAYDVDQGGSKEVSCVWDWRNDGLTWESVATYSDVCSLTVYIDDPHGIPVDNAFITIGSEFYYAPYPLYAGTWGETDQNGEITFVLGNNQNYYIKLETELGSYPASGYAELINGSIAGEHYYWNWTTTGEMTQLAPTELPSGTQAPYVVEVQYDLPYDVQHGHDWWAGPLDVYAEKLFAGQLTFFLVDAVNLDAYLAGEPFSAYEVAEGLSNHQLFFHPPTLEDYYLVLSGAEHHRLGTLANITVRLWEREPAAVAPSDVLADSWQIVPSPFARSTRIEYRVPGTASALVRVSVHDLQGRLVCDLSPGGQRAGRHQVRWNGTDAAGQTVSAGVYYCRLRVGTAQQQRTLVLVR